MSELKPCPFCGGSNTASYLTDFGDLRMYCINCYEDGNGLAHNSDTWNTRPIEDELQHRIDELTDENALLFENKRLRHALGVIADSDGHHDHSLTHSQLIEYAKDTLDFVSTRQAVPIDVEIQMTAELAALKSENVKLSKKVTDYEKELRQSHKYDNTCSTCRYLDENKNCVLGGRCVNYAMWQGKIL